MPARTPEQGSIGRRVAPCCSPRAVPARSRLAPPMASVSLSARCRATSDLVEMPVGPPMRVPGGRVAPSCPCRIQRKSRASVLGSRSERPSSALIVRASQRDRLLKASPSRKAGRSVGSAVDGRLLVRVRGDSSVGVRSSRDDHPRPASLARAPVAAVGSTRRRSRCARSPTRSQRSSSTSHRCRAHHGPRPGLAPAARLRARAERPAVDR
jgi:hypothetical protein